MPPFVFRKREEYVTLEKVKGSPFVRAMGAKASSTLARMASPLPRPKGIKEPSGRPEDPSWRTLKYAKF